MSGPHVEPGQVWADKSEPGRTVRVISTDGPDVAGGRARVETVSVRDNASRTGGRVTSGRRTSVLTCSLRGRYRLVQHADGSAAS